MGRRVCLGLFVLTAVCASSCDTDQPLQIGEQDGLITIRANGAGVPRYFTWLVFDDSNGDTLPDDVNGDGQIDDDDKTLWCEVDASGGVPLTASPISVPWTYSLKVRVIRAGQTSAELLTSTAALAQNFNRAPYDTAEPSHTKLNPSLILVSHDRGECSGNMDIPCNPNSTADTCEKLGGSGQVCNPVFVCDAAPAGSERRCAPTDPGGTCQALGAGICTLNNTCSNDPFIACMPTCQELGYGSCVLDELDRRFRFESATRRQLTEANRELLEADGNVIYDACSGDAACMAQVDSSLGGANIPLLGNCPANTVGEPALDPGNPNAGLDNLSFSLDSGDTLLVEARRSSTVPGGGINFINPSALSATVFIDGAQLSPNEVNGNLSATDADDPFISFSYTSQ